MLSQVVSGFILALSNTIFVDEILFAFIELKRLFKILKIYPETSVSCSFIVYTIITLESCLPVLHSAALHRFFFTPDWERCV